MTMATEKINAISNANITVRNPNTIFKSSISFYTVYYLRRLSVGGSLKYDNYS